MEIVSLVFTGLVSMYDVKSTTVEPRSKAPAYKVLSAYKAFKQNPQHIFCSTFYFGSTAFSL